MPSGSERTLAIVPRMPHVTDSHHAAAAPPPHQPRMHRRQVSNYSTAGHLVEGLVRTLLYLSEREQEFSAQYARNLMDLAAAADC